MRRQKHIALLLFLGPAVLLYTVLVACPNAAALYVSLLRWGGYTGTREFVGLENFKRLLLAPSGPEAPAGGWDATLLATIGVSLGLLAGAVGAHLRLRRRPTGLPRSDDTCPAP